jgi:hypothetical protein
MSLGGAIHERAHDNPTIAFAAQAQLAITDPQQTGTAGLNHLDATTGADAKLGHSANPARVAINVMDFGPLAGPEKFQGEQRCHGCCQW